jgi:hypothetical protein
VSAGSSPVLGTEYRVGVRVRVGIEIIEINEDEKFIPTNETIVEYRREVLFWAQNTELE